MNKKRLFLVIFSVFLCALQSIYAADPKDIVNWTDGGKDYSNKYGYDTTWYKASDSEYTISTPEQLGAFAVASATDTFEGKTVKLAADLDMSKYGWVSIGKAGFKGTFDGMGHTVVGMSYRDAAQAKVWGLFHTIDGGTVKNILVAASTFANEKEGTDCPSVGGIAAILKGDGIINNCGFSGSVQLPFAAGAENLGKKNGLMGGLVGIIESGTVSNSFAMNRQPIVPNDTIYGNIAGRSKGTITNCYFMLNDSLPDAVNKKQAQGTLNNVNGKESNSFASGEVAYLLNTDNKGIWGQSNDMPALTSKEVPTIYKIVYPADSEKGKVTGLEFASVGETVTLIPVAEEGYVIRNLEVSGATLVNYSTFVMPDKDVTVSYQVEAISNTEIQAFPAEKVKSMSFVAKWNKIEGATDYKITVKKGDVVLSAYNALSVGDVTSALVGGLNQNATYTYTVQSVKDEIVSEASNTVTVATADLEVRVVYKEGHVIELAWDSVEGADKYVITITDKAGISTGGETKECTYKCTNLTVGNAYTIIVAAEDGAGNNLTVSDPILETTDLDYGTQLRNGSFELWHNEGLEEEPIAWHSFMSGGGGLSSMTKNVHMDKSSEIRPGSSGSTSVRIWTKPIMTVPANGNLTCGRVNSGSMTATNQANHNRSFIDEPDFCQPLNGACPDSLTVWVNFSHTDKDMYARVAATIHDKYNFADPSTTADSLHAVAKAELDYKSVNLKGGWQRLTIPFDYKLAMFDAFYDRMNQDQQLKDSLKVDKIMKPTSADYMLVTFSTNKTPGVGKANDQVFIDDLLLVYKPVLKLTKTSFTEKQISVEYTLTGTMSPSNLNMSANVVSLELSDAEGSFAEPEVLTQMSTDKSGILVADVDRDLAKGNYRIRVVTTNYPMVSEEIYTATGLPVVKALAATDIEGDSFVANWAAPLSQEPKSYKLTVKAGSEVVSEYNDKETGNVTSYPVKGLQANVAYTYTVKAVYDEAQTGASNTIEVVTIPAVKALAATAISEGAFIANWEAITGAQPSNYLLTVREGEGKFEIQGCEDIPVAVTASSYEIKGMKANTIYTYFVKAVYGNNVLKSSNEITLITTFPAVTTKAASSITDSSFVANWNVPASMKPTAYRLTVKQGDVIVEDYDNKEVEKNNQQVVGLKPNTAYTYTVKAVYGDKESLESPAATVTTKCEIVKALDATATGEGSFTANWAAPTTMEAVNYKITVKEGNTVLSTYKDKETGLVTSFRVEGLKANTQYTYTVKASYAGNLTSDASNSIAVTTLIPVGIENATANGKVSVYPNPAVDVLHVKGVADDATYTIYDMSGRIIDKGNLSVDMVDVRNLRSGIYFIETTSGKVKFIKE